MAVKQNKFLGEYSSVELESLAEYLFPKSYVEEAEVEIEDLIQLIWEPKGRKLLDIPCGVARHSLLLAKAGFNVTGVDFCQELLQGIEERAKADGIPYETVKEDMRSFERSNYEAFPIRLWELAWPHLLAQFQWDTLWVLWVFPNTFPCYLFDKYAFGERYSRLESGRSAF